MDVGRLDVEQALGSSGRHTASLLSQEGHCGWGEQGRVSMEEEDATWAKKLTGESLIQKAELAVLALLVARVAAAGGA